MGDDADQFDRVFSDLNQVRELQERNQQLLGILDAKNEEIAELQELAEAAAELQAADAHAQKIVQLSKKNRSLNLALEKERSLSVQLAGELRNAKAAAAAAGGGGGASDVGAAEAAARHIVQEAAAAAAEAEKEAEQWREKYQQATQKQMQAEAKAVMTKKETEKMQRLLQREVGDGVDLTKVLDESSNWRGRAQQISLLKDKLREARASGGTEAGTSKAAKPHEEAHRKNLDDMKERRKVEADKLSSELEEARAEMDKMRLKCDGATSRKKVLENEVKNLKEKLAILLQKTGNDDKLIGALRVELSTTKRTQGKASAEAGGLLQQQAVRNLEQQVAERDAQIQRQEMIIRTLQAHGTQ